MALSSRQTIIFTDVYWYMYASLGPVELNSVFSDTVAKILSARPNACSNRRTSNRLDPGSFI